MARLHGGRAGHHLGCPSGGTEEQVGELIERLYMVIRLPELDINQITQVGRNLVGARDRELEALKEPIRRLKWRVADMNDIVSDGEEPEPIHHAAAGALRVLENYRMLLIEEREQLLENALAFASRKRPNRENLLQRRLFDVVEQEWRKAGGAVSHAKDYRTFWEAVILPPYRDRWVQQVKGVAPADGMFKAHVEAVLKRDRSARSRN